jgi:hypothetical protein
MKMNNSLTRSLLLIPPHSALDVFNIDTHALQCARAHVHLGLSYAQRVGGKVSANIEKVSYGISYTQCAHVRMLRIHS